VSAPALVAEADCVSAADSGCNGWHHGAIEPKVRLMTHLLLNLCLQELPGTVVRTEMASEARA